jgi:hypothetical protein
LTISATQKSADVFVKGKTALIFAGLATSHATGHDATMRPMRQALVLILATKVAVGLSVLQPATIFIYGSVNLRNEINKCTCIKYFSSRD